VSAGPTDSIPPSAPFSRTRLWLFRALALFGLPLLLLLGIEGGLRLAGYGRATDFLVPDDQPGFYRTNPGYVRLFMPAGFDLRPLNWRVAKEKPPGTLRVVVLGESAAQGIPAPAFGFVPQLRAQLRARCPGQNIEVLNTGIVAINSHVVRRIARDLAEFAPDLFVVYLGNNEVVGPYGPGCTYLSETPPLRLIRASVAVRASRTGQLLGDLLGRLSPRRPPAEWGGMGMFVEQAVPGDDPRLATMERNFEANLRDIVRVATGAGAKTLLCTVVANLKDSPPFLSRHRAGLAGAELERWSALFERGRVAWRLGDHATALPLLEEALRLDPRYAGTHFMLGDIALAAGDDDTARRSFVEALRRDALRFRPAPRLNDIIRRVADENPEVALVDIARLLGADPESTAPLAGRDLLFEHVHFDWEGNYRVARAMAENTEKSLGAAPGAPAWLDSAGCAAALGYTPAARPGVLRKIAPLMQSPPFTNQLTYPEDQARFSAELARADTLARRPETLRAARETVAAAIVRDPANADLAKPQEEIADELGDRPAALAAAQRAEILQPRSYAVSGNVAIKLARLGRHAEAEQVLRDTAAASTPAERAQLAPAFGDLYARTGRPAEYEKLLRRLLSSAPHDAGLRVLLAEHLRTQGNPAAAEAELRAVLDRDPGHAGAQEALVKLLEATGRAAEAEQASLDRAGRQTRNQANNLRAALAAEKRGDPDAEIRFLRAATRSGPVPSGLPIRLARKLLERDRAVEALGHLAEARLIAHAEGDTATAAAVEDYIRQMRGGRP
jgi:tetratricopeptide (TPR) repeat protein